MKKKKSNNKKKLVIDITKIDVSKWEPIPLLPKTRNIILPNR